MSGLKKTIFISDLHLDESHPEITRGFLHLLQQCDSNVDALYILGDLFEVWIGDDNNSNFQDTIISALKSATDKGLRIYFMFGNRDFLIGKRFLNATGCELLPDEAKINLYSQQVLLMHGDTLCTRDVAYLKARKFAHNPLVQKLFLALPLSLRKYIACRLREKSMAHTSSAASDIMDVTQSEVERVMTSHNACYLIHGHTHQPAFHEFHLNHSPALRIVLGAWHERGNMLVWDQNGHKEWLEFSFT